MTDLENRRMPDWVLVRDAGAYAVFLGAFATLDEVVDAAEASSKSQPTLRVLAMRPAGCFLRGHLVDISPASANVSVVLSDQALKELRQTTSRWIIYSPEHATRKRSYLMHNELPRAIIEADRLSRKHLGNSMLIMEPVFGAMHSKDGVTEFINVWELPR